jgi:hypothetical protein
MFGVSTRKQLSIPCTRFVFRYQKDSLRRRDLIATDDHADIRGLVLGKETVDLHQVRGFAPIGMMEKEVP